jgi:hypothetical protein
MRRILLVLTVALVMAAMMLGTALPAGALEPLPPSSTDQCKNGGYAFFYFENQGQCIKFVNQLT